MASDSGAWGQGMDWLAADLCSWSHPNVTANVNCILGVLVGFFIHANKQPSSTDSPSGVNVPRPCSAYRVQESVWSSCCCHGAEAGLAFSWINW